MHVPLLQDKIHPVTPNPWAQEVVSSEGVSKEVVK